MAKELLKESLGSEEKILEVMLNLSAGKAEDSPFEDAVAEGFRNWLTEHLCVPEDHRGKPERAGDVLRFHLLLAGVAW